MIVNEREYNRLISRNLRRLALEHGVTQSEIAEKLNVSKATVSLWFNGKNTPRMDKIDAICKWWNINRSDIMENRDKIKEVYIITSEDMKLITAYHAAAPFVQQMVRFNLGIEGGEDNGEG